MPSQAEYSRYLQNRSVWGSLYRRYVLYPRISKLLNGDVLDIGCGIGDMLAYRFGSVGVDVNLYNVRFCLGRGLSAHIMQFDKLPFENQSFHSALLDNVLEHIAEPLPLLSEIHRVLCANGVLVIGVPGLKGQAADLDHKVYYTEVALEALAEKSGFRVKKYMYAPLFRSPFLSRALTQYCIYTQWQKID